MLTKIKDKFKAFLPEKWPSLYQCRKISVVLNEKEKAILQIATTVFITSVVVLSFLFYTQKTEIVPTFGGKYTEGVIGSPQFINPMYSTLNDADRDISSILFSGLIKYNSSGKPVLNLAQDIKSHGRIYEVTLKEDLYWSDGKPITADDIVFTVKAIQNQKTRSPLRPSWVGIQVEKISDLRVIFKLEQASPLFINRLSLQIIPSHIWEDTSFENFAFSHHNFNPVSSGPYKIKEIYQGSNGNIKKIDLEPNPYYHGKKPYIEEVSFVFYNNLEDLINASKRNEIDGFSNVSPKDYDKIIKETGFNEYSFQISRYFGLFFNHEKRELLEDQEFRKALNYGINKEEIIKKVLSKRGYQVNSPVLPEIYGFDFNNNHEFNPERSNEILDNLGFKRSNDGFREKLIRESETFEFKSDLRIGSQGDEVRYLQRCLLEGGFFDSDDEDNITGFFESETRDAVNAFQEEYRDEILAPSGFSRGTGMVSENTRKKLNELCQDIPRIIEEVSFVITTVNQPLMEETAEEIKRQWEELGVKVDIKLLSISELENDIIKPRDYEMLLFGKALDPSPDFFHFWHSSQKTEYGFNLSMYENDSVDVLLNELRREEDKKIREEKIREINSNIVNDIPAIFLFNPDFIFYASDKIRGIQERVIFNPSQRFNDIENWYIKTRRIKI